jgi:hypothetical protein
MHLPPDNKIPHACVVHLGFSGSLDLFPGISDPLRRARFTEEATRQVTEKLRQLHGHEKLGLHEGHFLVGIAQMAVGGDWVFADACEQAGLEFRAFLPQTRDEFLLAKSAKPPHREDFTTEQRAQALQRLQRDSVIQERVVSVSPDRTTRFIEASAEILRIADIAVTLQPRDAAAGKAGGTSDFAERARATGKAVYALSIFIDEKQQLQVTDELWLPPKYAPPRLPSVIGEPVLQQREFAIKLKDYGSAEAKRYRDRFERDSWWVIWTHVGATGLAALALALSYVFKSSAGTNALVLSIAALLFVELFLLGLGFLRHRALHDEAVVSRWTDLRLTAEITRSTLAFSGQHHYLAHLFTLPLPESYEALTRTLNVLHLRATRAQRGADWKAQRDNYVHARLEHPDPRRGQIAYFTQELEKARRHAGWATRCFTVLSLTAIGATTIKLLAPPLGLDPGSSIAATLSWAAIVLPVFAVGFLSHLAVLDREARANIYSAMLGYLEKQAGRFRLAGSEPEFLRLQTETEMKLLSETLNWYWRRRFINPA